MNRAAWAGAMALCLFGMGPGTAAAGQDQAAIGEAAAMAGEWVLNLAQSIPPQGKSFSPFRLVVRESGAMLDFTQYTTNAAGQEVEFSHRSPTDGVERDLPGMPGARAAFTRLPSGVIDAKLRFPDGSLQNKICVLEPSLRRQMCLATITSPSGHTVFFKHVLDKISPD